jgi:tetratricopeptide (TPR) repeat protein
MQTPLPDSLAPTRDLFLDFVDAATADATEPNDSAARELISKTRASLRGLHDDALMMIAARAQEPAQANEAIRLSAAIAKLEPERAAAWFAAGLAMQFANRHAEAIQPYRRALAIARTFPNLRNNLAGALMQINSNSEEVRVLLEETVAEEPGNANGWINLSRLLPTDTDVTRPLEASRRALALAPQSALSWNNYAMACKEAQQWDEAERAAHSACQYAPNDATQRLNLSMIQLLRGNFAEGWPGHELRWRGSSELAAGRPVFPKPEWRGEPLAGRTLLVWGEQGMGDLLQFCRYVPMLAERVHREGGRLVWNSFPQMGALLSRSLGGHCDLYCAGGPVEALPPYDCEVSLLSLPLIFGTREDTIPGPTGYLKPEPAAAARWRERLAAERRLKVGLAWTGSLTHKRNPFRRVGLDRFAAHFAGIGDAAFYSLQPGAGADVEAARAEDFEVTDFSAEWKTFDDTAAFVDALDLVISVCTSSAHLAGALGQRAWVLLDVNPHWVWELERRDSPWYPNTTLYRQKQFREWEPVLDPMSADLAKLAGDHRAARKQR